MCERRTDRTASNADTVNQWPCTLERGTRLRSEAPSRTVVQTGRVIGRADNMRVYAADVLSELAVLLQDCNFCTTISGPVEGGLEPKLPV